MAWWKARGKFFIKSWNLDQALWKARGELKSSILDHGIVERKSGTINKELDFRSWHCGRQGRGSS